ncbi:hypothetical protein [Aestuariibaculum lutulentum]|uniref:Uncharacterized protein n=1 Tax=Aestuariibaculum lutulentum TaxID=2920935 RepID=A0ABS9RGY8_9FLAO|nr:hypothetical protein [Aestuariibaculum lutulentum]MCH4552213.1 hypothetical protein [Aestuariibaculum lutulentum]
MKSFTLILTSLILIVSCTSEPNKSEYLIDFNKFITNLKTQKEEKQKIDWTSKEDSLNILLYKKSHFRLNSKDQKTIESFIESFNALKENNFESSGKVNFYFENSASMNGYLDGKNFKQVLHRIYGNLSTDNVNSYFVNTKEYFQDDILKKIDNKDIKVGDIGNSDHQFIFSNAIDNAKNNNLSIVITDGIYSVKGGDIDIVSIDIENTFKTALSKNEIETAVLKLSSNFNGIYYSETCEPGKKAIKINQNRPYYILMFGNSKIIDKALEEIAIIKELPGFEQQARFFLTENLKANYTILTKGEEKHGIFKATTRGTDLFHEIEDVEKFEKPGFNSTPKNENYFSFGLAIDYSKINLPNSYKQNQENYLVNDQLGYSIVSISNINDLDKSSKTYEELQRINDKNQTNFTHVIQLKADRNLYGNFQMQLLNKLPKWIKETGIENDCNINSDDKHTFAFDQLMIGISKAYQKVNNNKEYLDINLKITP